MNIGYRVCNIFKPLLLACISGLLASRYLLPGTTLSDMSPCKFLFAPSNASHNVYEYLLLLLCIFTLVSYVKLTRSEKRLSFLLACLGITMFMYLLGIFLSNDNIRVHTNCIAVLVVFTIGLIAARICTNTLVAIHVLVAFSSLQAIFTLYYRHIGINYIVSGDVVRAGGTFNNPSGVCILMLISLPLALFLGLDSIHKFRGLLYLCLSGIMLGALLLTYYRAGIIAFSFAGIYLVYRLYGIKAGILILVLCSMLIMFVVSTRQSDTLNRASSNRSVTGRLAIWNFGLKVFLKNWSSGVGVGRLEIPVYTMQPNSTVQISEIDVEPKNVILHWLDEMGLGGGILLLLILYHGWKALLENNSSVSIGLIASWLSLVIYGFFDTLFGVTDRYFANFAIGMLLGSTFLLAPTTLLAKGNLEYSPLSIGSERFSP